MICSGKDGLTGSFFTKDDFCRLYDAQLNIKSMPNNSEEEVVSVNKPLTAYEVLLLGLFQLGFKKVKCE